MSTSLRYGWLAFGGAAALCVGAITSAQGCTILTNDALPDDAGTDGPEAGTALSCNTCVANECTGPWAVCLLDGTCLGLHACSAASAPGSSARLACTCGTDGDASVEDAGSDAEAGALDAGAPLDALAAYRMFAACNDLRTGSTCAADCATTCATGGSRTFPSSCGSPSDAGADAADATVVDAGDAAVADAGDAGDGGVGDASTADGGSTAPTGLDPRAVDACSACVSTACADPKSACAAGTDCAAFLACAFACTDAACATQCGVTYSAGKTAASTLSNCTITSCSGACGL